MYGNRSMNMISIRNEIKLLNFVTVSEWNEPNTQTH